MLPNINIIVQSGRLGQVGITEDGIAALIVQGVAVAGSIALWSPYVFYGMDEVVAKGFSATYDNTNRVRCFKHMKDFYDEAGAGAELQVMVVPQNETYVALFSESGSVAKLKNWLLGGNGRVKMLGVTRSPNTAPVVANGMSSEIANAAALIRVFGDWFVANYMPIRFLVEARDLAWVDSGATILDLKTLGCPYMAVVAGDNVTGSTGAALGLALGRLAKIPVQRNIARVLDGNITASNLYFGDVGVESAPNLAAILDLKGFITFRKHVGRAGYFFTDDPTAASATDDYNKIARGRVLDKAIRVAYATYLNYLNDEISIHAKTGRVEAATIKSYQAAIERTLNLAMTANSEISGVRAVVDPMQNVLATNKICVDLYITPVGYAREIVVKLGFSNTQIDN